MEIQAWIEGLEAIAEAHGPCQVIVCSDSHYVGLGAMDRNRQRLKNGDLWTLLDAAVDRHLYVEYQHVKGHSGHRLNNIVDKLANETRKK
jgi:ribonuclease HI